MTDKQKIHILGEALAFYGDPDTYFAIGFLPDRPCGAFAEDFSKISEDAYKPGKLARKTLSRVFKKGE